MKENNKQEKSKVKKLNKKEHYWSWPIKVFFLAFALSLFFSISSELLLSASGIIISSILIVILIGIAVITDMIGVAVTACPKEPFRAMASRKVRGAKESLSILNKADRVANLCADVIGDICGILSGAAGTAIVLKIINTSTTTALQVIIASLISASIAGLTIFGKAMGKKYSLDNCEKIVTIVGKFLSAFNRQEPKKK